MHRGYVAQIPRDDVSKRGPQKKNAIAKTKSMEENEILPTRQMNDAPRTSRQKKRFEIRRRRGGKPDGPGSRSVCMGVWQVRELLQNGRL